MDPQQNNQYKLNTDGSCIRDPGKGGIWGMVRNSKGEWVIGFLKS